MKLMIILPNGGIDFFSKGDCVGLALNVVFFPGDILCLPFLNIFNVYSCLVELVNLLMICDLSPNMRFCFCIEI